MRFRHAALRSPLRDFRRPARLALPAFFALTLTLGLAGPLWAAGNVSNLNLSADEGSNVNDHFPAALGFTTGDHSAGYALQSVTLKLKLVRSSDGPYAPDVALFSEASGNPGTLLATLTAPNISDATMSDRIITCSNGCQLDDNTSYFIVVAGTKRSAKNIHWGQNPLGTETNTPSNAGWSLADVAKWRAGLTGAWSDESPAVARLMKVSWATPTLTASSVEATSATLTIANYTGNWYYKQTSPTTGQCSSAVSTTTKSVGSLDSGTSYTFKAYSDISCADELDSETLLTKPAKVAGVSATAGNTSLDVSWTAATGAASYKIQWKSGTEAWGRHKQAGHLDHGLQDAHAPHQQHRLHPPRGRGETPPATAPGPMLRRS